MKHHCLYSVLAALTILLGACSSSEQRQQNASADPVATTGSTSPNRTGTTSKNWKTPIRPLNPADAPAAFDKPAAPRIPGSRVSSVSVPTRTVALTFDDGPHGTLTPRILNILAKHNAKATFFVLGSNVERHPAIVRRIINEGHEIANHTWNHPNLVKTSRQAIASQLTRTNDAIINACGRKPRLMRPPYGAINSSLTAWMKQEYGLTTVMWNVDTNDWRKPGVSTVISRAVNGAKPGAIILVHDIHASTADAVEGIVTGLQRKGYELVTVSELISRGHRYARQAKHDHGTQPGQNTSALLTSGDTQTALPGGDGSDSGAGSTPVIDAPASDIAD